MIEDSLPQKEMCVICTSALKKMRQEKSLCEALKKGLLFEPEENPIGAMNDKIDSEAITSTGEFNPFSEAKGFFSNFFRSGGVFVTFSAAGKSKKFKLER